MDNNVIFYIFGKSGVGKDTIINKVIEKTPFLHKLNTYTTRPMREGEVNGDQYIFLSQHEFVEMKDQDTFMETRKYEFIHNGFLMDVYYATGKPKEKISICCAGDTDIYGNIIVPENTMIIPILITIDEEERLYRMIKRDIDISQHVDKQTIHRFFRDNREFKHIGYHRIIENHDIDSSVNELCDFINEFVKEV